jgi:phage RecT family recombinase
MTNQIAQIKSRLEQSPLLKEVLGKGKDKYILSVLSEISKSASDPKKDLTKCTPESIVNAVKQANDLSLEIDSRQHCHLIKYGNTANLQVGYRGYIYSIKRAYPDANIDCKLVYEGDNFTLKKEGDTTTYSLDIDNPFAKRDKVVGGFCYISYTSGGRMISFCETMSIEEINKIKGCAKQGFIWDKWFEEKAKVAIIKRACKVHFSGINEIANITEFDNEEFDFEQVNQVAEVQKSIDSEQAFEIEELAKKAKKSVEDICKIYQIDSIIQLPIGNFEKLKQNLESNANT